MMLGLEITEPIDRVIARLSERGARFTGSVIRDTPGNFAHLEDPDGNAIYLWEVNVEAVPASGLAYSGAGRE